MAIKVAELNAHDGFSNEALIAPIISRVIAMEADVAVFPEAYAEGEKGERFLGEVEERFIEERYIVARALYNDAEHTRTDRHGLLVATRLTSAWPAKRLATRTGIFLEVADEYTGAEVSILCAHWDDRSEANRLAQVKASIAANPQVMVVDGNYTNRRLPLARLATRLPAHYPTPESGISRVERAFNIAQRVGSMVNSRAGFELEAFGYRDANVECDPTWPSRHPTLDLDHILVDRLSPSRVRARDFEVHERIDSLDHLPISAVIET